MTNKKIKYSEPAEYFPKEVREKYKLGEYAENKNKKDYCLLCNKYVDSIIINKTEKYEDDLINIEYDGKAAVCPICKEELYNEEVIKYNRLKIIEKYKIENEIVTK